MDFPTFDDLFRIARDEAMANNSVITRAVADRPGTDFNALIAGSAAVGDDLSGQLTKANSGLFFSTARRNQLDLLAADRFQGDLPRKSAAPARVDAIFSLATAPGSSFSIPDGTLVSTADNRVFRTIGQYTFTTAITSITIPVQSVKAGLSQQIVAGALTSITSGIPGAPPTLAVTNAVASFGADDAEEDDDYKLRCQKYYAATRRGTLAAIEQGATTVPGVRTALAYEGDRYVELVITDAFTAQLIDATSVPAAYQTQSTALAAAIQAALLEWRGGGIQVFVTPAVVSLFAMSLILKFRSNVDTALATNTAKMKLMSYVNGLRPGQSFIYADAENILRQVPGLVVAGGEIVYPNGDVIPRALEALRTDLSLIGAAQL